MPGCITCTGGMMMCSFGAAPSVFNPTPGLASTTGGFLGSIMDFAPFVNIPPFGVCTSLANPTVAAATAAALGVLTPMPCIPATVAPWVMGVPQALNTKGPLLDQTSKLMCMWGGVINFTFPGVSMASD